MIEKKKIITFYYTFIILLFNLFFFFLETKTVIDFINFRKSLELGSSKQKEQFVLG